MTIHEPVGALGIVLAAGVVASAASSALTGRIMSRFPVGSLLAVGAALVGTALAVEAAAPALWLIALGSAVFSTGFGTIDAALNAHAAARFGPRNINWMHASYGLGATLGPLLVTAMLSARLSWRFAFASMAAVMAVIALVLTATRHEWTMPRDGASAQGPPYRGPGRYGGAGSPSIGGGLGGFAPRGQHCFPGSCSRPWRPESSRRRASGPTCS